MQSMAKAAPTDAARPAKPTIANTLAYIYRENGIKGLYRGVTPRIGLGIWQTVRSLPSSRPRACPACVRGRLDPSSAARFADLVPPLLAGLHGLVRRHRAFPFAPSLCSDLVLTQSLRTQVKDWLNAKK